jgi:hypothetical protein
MNKSSRKFYRQLILLFLRWKDSPYYSFVVYSLILFISLLLIFYLVIPEFENWLSVQKEVNETKNRIAIMRKNLQLLQTLSDTRLTNDFTTATAALPSDRDVSRVLAALNYTALQAGVGMDDFAFQAGEITSRSSKSKPTDLGLLLSFNVTGPMPQVLVFLRQVQEKLPLMSLSAVDATFSRTNVTRITLWYHYKTLPLYREAVETPLTGLSTDNRQLLEKLRSWDIPAETEYLPAGGESADPL